MNIKKLKLLIKDLPDDMPLCGSGHFGEQLEVYCVTVGTVGLGAYGDKGKIDALVIDMQDKGEEPD